MRPKRHLPERVSVRPSAVTVSRLPVVRCAVCGKTMAHQPGQAAAVLTEHYRKEHQK
jgi:hypothetical protein